MSKIILGDQSIFPKEKQKEFANPYDIFEMEKDDTFSVLIHIGGLDYESRNCKVVKNDTEKCTITAKIYKRHDKQTIQDAIDDLMDKNIIEIDYLNVIKIYPKLSFISFLILFKNAFIKELLHYPKIIISKIFPKK